MAWGVRARSWNAKSPEEQRLEYATHRLEAHQDRLHGQIKNETRLLNEVAEIAAEGARDARHAYNAANMYGYGSPYNRMPSGRIHSPLLGPPLMAPHPHSVYGTPLTHVSPLPLGIGISPHLDPAYTVGHLQARREMAIAEQRRRRMLQQRQILAQRQALDDMAMLAMTPRVRTTSVPRIDTPMYLGRTPYVNNAAYIPSTPLTVGTPFIGRTPYTAPLALDSIHIATPRMPGPLYDPLMSTLEPHSAYDELAALTIPPGSVRMRRLSEPAYRLTTAYWQYPHCSFYTSDVTFRLETLYANLTETFVAIVPTQTG